MQRELRLAFASDDFDDVEAEDDIGIIEQPHPRPRPAGDEFALLIRNRFGGTAEFKG